MSRPSASGGPLVRTQDVTRRFGPLTVVDRITMHVDAGEVVGLLGANGAGKTTLMRMSIGLLDVTSGTVALLGAAPDRERRRRLGYVPQGLGLYRDLTVMENLAFSSQAYGVTTPPLTPALEPFGDQLIAALPLGLQRQVAFLAALAHAPDVLVLDEPTSGVDPLAAAGLWDLIHDQAERRAGVLVSTHNMQEAQQCDRLLLISGGRIVAQGSEADIIGTTSAVEVRTDDWTRAFAVLGSAGMPVMLSGRSVRVADVDPRSLRTVLEDAGVRGEVVSVPATIEERMAALDRAAAPDGTAPPIGERSGAGAEGSG